MSQGNHDIVDYLTLAWVVVAVLGYLGTIVWALLDPKFDEDDWGNVLMLGMIGWMMWPPALAIGIIFGAIPEGLKALHRWIHRERTKPSTTSTPTGAPPLDVLKH